MKFIVVFLAAALGVSIARGGEAERRRLTELMNSINAKYVEPGEGWTAKDAPALIDEDLEAIDGGRRQPVDLQFEYVPFARQVQRQCRAALTDYRRERRHALPLAPEAWRLEAAIDFVS